MPREPLRGVCVLLDSGLHQQPSEIRVCPTEDVLGTIAALASEPGAPNQTKRETTGPARRCRTEQNGMLTKKS
jgi:hypothetical protein